MAADDALIAGRRAVRRAVLIGLVVPTLGWGAFVLAGMLHRRWAGEMGGFFVILTFAGAITLTLAFAAGWWVLFPALRLGWQGVRSLVPNASTPTTWDAAAADDLALLPYAAAAEAAVWATYLLGDFGGGSDVIFGILGNLVWIVLAVTLARRWVKRWRDSIA